MTPVMNIAVVGCGIAGTAVARFLAERGHHITIFEQSERLTSVGAGVLLQPSGQTVLARLGIRDAVQTVSEPLDGLLARHENGKTLVRLRYDWGDEAVGYGVHRGRLFSELLALCRERDVNIRTGFRVQRVIETKDDVGLESERGDFVGGFNAVIGADGSGSALRASAAPKSDVVAYRDAALWATGPCEHQPGHLLQIMTSTRQLIGLLPIGQGESSLFVGLLAKEHPVTTSFVAWKNDVRQRCPESSTLLEHLTSFGDLTFARYRHVTMNKFHYGRVLFIGDAAHATSPHLGQGVNLALEDAAAFADCLGDTDDFDGACKRYTAVRRRKILYYQQLTRFLTPFFQSSGPIRGTLRNLALPLLPHAPGVRTPMIRTLSGQRGSWWG